MSEQEPQSDNNKQVDGRKRFRKRWLLLPIVLIAGAFFTAQRYGLHWRGTLLSGNIETTVKHSGEVQIGSGQSVVEEEPLIVTTEDVLGKWVLNGAIKRVIDNRPDGTATIHVTFDFVTALRYGSELDLDLEWTLNNENVLTHKIVGGSPEKGKKRLISDFGNKSYFKILSIDDKQMHLVDFDDPPEEYLWKRIDTDSDSNTSE